MSTTNIALLHLWILASQAFYMHLSNKAQLKKHLCLFLIAIPIVTAYPALISSRDMQAYTLYEYAVVFCVILAAAVDISLAAFNREYMTDKTGRSLTYSYLLITAAAAFWGNAGITVRIIPVFLITGSFLMFTIVKKHSAAEFIKSIPLALVSVICSWVFIRFGL